MVHQLYQLYLNKANKNEKDFNLVLLQIIKILVGSIKNHLLGSLSVQE